MRNPIRPVIILGLEPSGIGKVTALGLGNPDVLPLWFGETDLITPPFIRQAAAQALEDGRTFYTNARGILPLRAKLSAISISAPAAPISRWSASPFPARRCWRW